MYHIVICDDDERFVTELQSLLSRYSVEMNLAIRVSPFKDGFDLIENYPMDVDLIFLDIWMAG